MTILVLEVDSGTPMQPILFYRNFALMFLGQVTFDNSGYPVIRLLKIVSPYGAKNRQVALGASVLNSPQVRRSPNAGF